MSLLTSFGNALQSSSNASGRRQARSMQEKSIQLAEEEAQRTRSLDDVYAVANLATDLGVSSNAGLTIDEAKLTALWETQAASGKIDPRLQQLAALLGNDDSAAKNNTGFSFKGVTLDGDTIALQGGYDGEETTKFSTVDRKPGDDAEVAFASYSDASGLMANQYNQMWNRQGVSGYKREYQLKNGLNKNSDQIRDNEALIYDAVGQLTNELEDAINKIAGNEKGAAITTKLKRALAGKPYTEQLKILQQYGSELQLPASEAITPEVKKAAAEADAVETTTTAEVKVKGGEATTDNSAKIAELEARMAKVPPGRAGVARKKELQNQIEQLKSEAPTATTTAENSAEIARLEEEIASIPSGEGRGGEVKREALQEQVDRLKGASPAPVAPTAAAEEGKPVAASGSGLKKAVEATEKDIVEGNVQFTQAEIESLQERLKAKGIDTLEEMNKATREEQQELRAMLSTIAVNKDQRAEYLKRMNNVMATGSADFNSKEMQEAKIAQQTEDRAGYQAETARTVADTGRLNYFRQVEAHDWKVSEKVGERIRDNFTTAKKAIYGVDDEGNLNNDINFDEDRFFSEYRGAFEGAFKEFRSASSGTPQKAETQVALNSMISMGIQALAESEEYGSFGENFLPDGAVDYIDGNDDLLSRLQVQSDGSVIVYDPTTGAQQDESVPKSVLRRIFGDSGYAYFVKEIRGAKGSLKARAKTNKAG